MELRVFWSALLRRWYLVILVIACTGYATYAIYDRIGPSYKAEGAALVFPPVTTVQRGATTGTQGNPYLELNGVSQARDIVIRSLTAKSVQEQLAEQFPGATFEATPDYTNSAPIILVTVKSPVPAQSIAAMKAVLALVPPTLSRLQDGLNLRNEEKITSRQLLADTEPDVVHTAQLRAGIVAGAGVLALGLLFIGLIDGMLAHRRRTRQRRAEQDISSSTVKRRRRRKARPTESAGDRQDEAGSDAEREAAGEESSSSTSTDDPGDSDEPPEPVGLSQSSPDTTAGRDPYEVEEGEPEVDDVEGSEDYDDDPGVDRSASSTRGDLVRVES